MTLFSLSYKVLRKWKTNKKERSKWDIISLHLFYCLSGKYIREMDWKGKDIRSEHLSPSRFVVLLAFSDIKSKPCKRWWRCSNRNGEWKWANRSSCSIKTQNDNQNKWDYQCTRRRKSARNICSGEAEINRIIRLSSRAFGKMSPKEPMGSSSCLPKWNNRTPPLYFHSLKLGCVVVAAIPSKKRRLYGKHAVKCAGKIANFLMMK